MTTILITSGTIENCQQVSRTGLNAFHVQKITHSGVLSSIKNIEHICMQKEATSAKLNKH